MKTGKPISFRSALAAAVALSVLLPACAHVPAFRPSRPLAEAPSLPEGLLLCHEYRIPPAPERPVVLRPFLDCLDELQERFPAEAAADDGFRAFRQEFHSSYATLGIGGNESWSARLGIELDLAIHAILRALWQPARPMATAFERELVLRDFPSVARRLEATGWGIEPTDGRATFDPRLERLKAGLAGLGAANLPAERALVAEDPMSAGEVALLCGRLQKLKDEVRYIDALRLDVRDFLHLQPRDPLTHAIAGKYSFRLDAAMRELEELRPKIADARAKGRFRVLACAN